MSDIKDIKFAKEGFERIQWADKNMPVLKKIRDRFEKEKPLKDIRIGCCLHVTTETANLMRTLKAGGAEVRLCASNPLSTQDDVTAALVKYFDIDVYAITGEDNKTYYNHIDSVLEFNPQVTQDDGCDLVSTLHSKYPEKCKNVIGGSEETTTGIIRLYSMHNDGALKYPIIAVNDAKTKHFFDNRYGTGQSTIDGIIRATDMLIAGSTVVVAGYGWCGRGVAMRAKGMGANVIITEVDHLKAIEAALDGFRVMQMIDAAPLGDLFVTLTGDINVIDIHHIKKMKDGAIICNSGHFDVEINLKELNKICESKKKVREFVDEYKIDGKSIHVLAEGRLINLAAANGHPAAVMDMSFANQSLVAEYFVKKFKNGEKLPIKVMPVPKDIDDHIAELKLESMNIKIDELTEEQKKYLASWSIGT
ncbi:adenosylhomocysteinase [candidate division TA06 bacterium]|uniref:Adenosylhomocysteinase n=1 Tax=candidate division TA06 bacterium TaxID=2250710 RepID=A0A660SD53_UNCT6|nr:MAG: adenosylhomocysteinase [candidate division TA06 bacterium]